MSSAFYITARTEPVDPGPGRYGRGTRLVLYDVPSAELATAWTEKYVQEVLLDRAEQKLVELKVIPMHDRLLSLDSDEAIDWTALIAHAEKRHDWLRAYPFLRRFAHRLPAWLRDRLAPGSWQASIEQSSSFLFHLQERDPSAATPEPATRLAATIAVMKKTIPHASQYNWRPSRHSYYVAHREDRAFVVRAMNIFFVSRSYTRALGDGPGEAHDVSIKAWPGGKAFPAGSASRDNAAL